MEVDEILRPPPRALVAGEEDGYAGIGRRLLETPEAYARECGVAELKIGVLQRNDGALRLCERYGFRQYRIALCKKLD